jgi:hypothetical protein
MHTFATLELAGQGECGLHPEEVGSSRFKTKSLLLSAVKTILTEAACIPLTDLPVYDILQQLMTLCYRHLPR